MKKYIVATFLCLSLVAALFIVTQEDDINQAVELEQDANISQPLVKTKIPNKSPVKVLPAIDVKQSVSNQLTHDKDKLPPIPKKRSQDPVVKNSHYYSNLFAQEAVDEDWAYRHQDSIYAYYYDFASESPNLFLDEVECRTSICQLKISAADKADLQQLMVNFLSGVKKAQFNENGDETIKRLVLADGLPRAELFILRYQE